MKNFYYFILLVLFTNFISASCSNSQIDINSATLSELDELTGIGPAKAQAIVNSRPFSRIDDLINVYGIGEATLEKIKLQDLACVATEETVQPQKTIEIKESEEPESYTGITKLTESSQQNPSENIINLNNDIEEEIVIYESKNEKINKNLLTGFLIVFVGIIYLLVKK